MTVYPWQQLQWNSLLSQHQQNRLPHALLLTGASGLGKHDFSIALAQTILCENPKELACCQCRSCHLFSAGSHPDFLPVSLEEKSKAIKVDQVRELTAKLSHTAQRNGFQVVVIYPAETMNRSAANALLKTLEEPSGNVLLLLVSDQAGHLPATILSRCQRVTFSCRDQGAATMWLQEKTSNHAMCQQMLKIANGSPLKALQLINENYVTLRNQLLDHLCGMQRKKTNPVSPVTALLKLDLKLVLHALLTLALDCLRLQLKVSVEYVVNSDRIEQLQVMSVAIKRPALLALLTQLQRARALLNGSIAVNTQLLLENVLLRWTC